jgi:gamma-glutamyltranspeptidase/glutathione hydrolase
VNLLVCPEIHAAKAAHDAFAEGASAMDAAVCAAFVQGVTNHLLCGIGGTLSVYGYDAATGRDFYVNGEEAMGSRPVPEEWRSELMPGRAEASGRYRLKSRANDVGYKAVMVPGFVRGCWFAYERFASRRLSWRRLLQPAIDLARDGFEVPPYSAAFWRDYFKREVRETQDSRSVPRWDVSAGSRALMLRDDRSPFVQGDRFVQEDLGHTIERIAEAGGDDFYIGELGEAIANELVKGESLVTAADVRGYTVDEDTPLRGSYRGMAIAAQPFSNGSKMIEMLQILDRFELAQVGHNTAPYIELVAKAMRAASSDALGVEGRKREEISAIEPQIISAERADYWAYRIRSGDPIDICLAEAERGTTHLTAVDAEGNMVSLNHSIGYGGSGVVVPGLGFLLNGDVGHYNPLPGQPDSVEPGKKFLGGSSLALFDDGKPFLVLGAPGGTRIVTSVIQTVLNVVDFGMDAMTAVTAPRFHSQGGNQIFPEPAIGDAVADELRTSGWDIRPSRYQARPQAVRLVGSRREGGSDYRGHLSPEISEYPDYDPNADPAWD